MGTIKSLRGLGTDICILLLGQQGSANWTVDVGANSALTITVSQQTHNYTNETSSQGSE